MNTDVYRIMRESAEKGERNLRSVAPDGGLEWGPRATVSEWLAAGGLGSGFFLLENPVRQTPNAIGFKALKFNSYGNEYEAVAWFPRRHCTVVINDHYRDKDGKLTDTRMFLVPDWLYRKKDAEYTLI